jgi:RHH-type rel operon transcriptional repressor/antitoxin RelB
MATSVRLSPSAEERLDFLAAHTKRTKAYYLREIIEHGLEDMEDYYLSAEILEHVRKKQEKIYSSEEMRKALDLDD